MANVRYIPSWEELKQLDALQQYKGVEVITLDQVKRLIKLWQQHGITVRNFDQLSLKQYLTRDDYNSIDIVIHEERAFSEGLEAIKPLANEVRKCFSRQSGDDD